MKKIKRWIGAAAVLCLAAALCACGKTAAAGESGAELAGADFLTHFYTTDDGGRYTALLEKSASGETAALTEMYYGTLADLVTADTLATLEANRLPYKYDKAESADGKAMTVLGTSLSPVEGEENSYTFVVTRTGDAGQETREGELRCAETDGKWRVEYFHEKS